MAEYVSVSDMAAEVARELQKEHMADIEKGTRLVEFEEDVNLMEKKGVGLFSKLEFRWRDNDALILDQIRAAANKAFVELFHDAITILDNLYFQLRVPELTENDIPRTDDRGRIIFQQDDRGNFLENWESLTGDDIEKALFDLTRLRFNAGPGVNNMLMEAMFAKRIYTDSYDDSYVSMLDGTIQDKTSKSNRKSRQDNYHAFFRFWLWSQGDTFMRELNNFQRVLERTRDWRVRSQQR